MPEKIVVIDYHMTTTTYMYYYVNGYMKDGFMYDPQEHGHPATDKELFKALQNLVGDENDIVIDIEAYAASFIEYIKRMSNYKIHIRKIKFD